MNIDSLNKNIDSFAYWNVPEIDLSNHSIKEREDYFHRAYNLGFPSKYKELLTNAYEVKYVFVGINRGSAGTTGELGNFHGAIKSRDFRLAAAAYNTAVWGAFMTDLSDEVNSHSSDVTVTKYHVKKLIEHLRELDIPNTVTLIAIGKQAYNALKANKELIHGNIEHIPHYSGCNRPNGKPGHWDTEKVHQLLQQISKNN